MINFAQTASLFVVLFCYSVTCLSADGFDGCSPCQTTFAGVSHLTGSKDVQCNCQGNWIVEIPQNLSRHLTKLRIRDVRLDKIVLGAFDMYPNLTYIIIENVPSLTLVEAAAFTPLKSLMKISITGCPSLKEISGTLLAGNNRLLKVDLSKNGLNEMPKFRMTPETVLTPHVDLSHNFISVIRKGTITSVSLSGLIVNNNQLERIESDVFNGSSINNLVLSNNSKLSTIDPDAFRGITLQKLDLSGTTITTLDYAGIKKLEVLNVKNVETLKTIPSVLDFPNLKKATFHYPFHCCFFKHVSVETVFGGDAISESVDQLKEKFCHDTTASPDRTTKPYRSKRGTFDDMSGFGTWGETVTRGNSTPKRQKTSPFDEGSIHDPVSHQNRSDEIGKHIVCSSEEKRNIKKWYNDIVCHPIANALNPCEDVMGGFGPRFIIWIVWIITILGNTAVIAVLLVTNSTRMRVHNFLIVNLAIADLCTGIYLAMLSVQDMMTKSAYYNFAVGWQTGNGCKVAGFLTVFASELSVATMLIISYDVWYNTRNIFYGRSLGFNKIVMLMGLSWLFAIVMATLPLLGVSSYSATSTCLPLKAENLSDRLFLYFGLGVIIFAFILMVIFYVNIYCDVSCTGDTASPTTRGQDLMIAKRMAILIGANFICWGPTVLFGITAAANAPLINIYASKWLLVLCYPLNSCANPFLYVFLTKRYRESMSEAMRKSEFLQGLLFTRPSRPTFTKEEWQNFNGTQTTYIKTPRPSDSSIKSSGNSVKIDSMKLQTYVETSGKDKSVGSNSPRRLKEKKDTKIPKFTPQMSAIIENSHSGSNDDHNDHQQHQSQPLLTPSAALQTSYQSADAFPKWCKRARSFETVVLHDKQQKQHIVLRRPIEESTLPRVGNSLRSRLYSGRPNSIGSTTDFYSSDTSFTECPVHPGGLAATKRATSVDCRSQMSGESGYNTSSPVTTPDPTFREKFFQLPEGRQTSNCPTCMTSMKSSSEESHDRERLIMTTKV